MSAYPNAARAADLRRRSMLPTDPNDPNVGGGVAAPPAPETVAQIHARIMGTPPGGAPAAPQIDTLANAQPSDITLDNVRRTHYANTQQYKTAYQSGDWNQVRALSPQLAASKQRLQDLQTGQTPLGPAPVAQTPEKVAAGRANLNAQANTQLQGQSEQAGMDAQTASYRAGMAMLPPNLRDQKFSSPQDQINHAQFAEFAGGTPQVDPMTMRMSSPGGDARLAAVQQQQALKDRMAKGIDFTPYDQNAAQASLDASYGKQVASRDVSSARLAAARAAESQHRRMDIESQVLPKLTHNAELESTLNTARATGGLNTAAAVAKAQRDAQIPEEQRAAAALAARQGEANVGLTEAQAETSKRQLEAFRAEQGRKAEMDKATQDRSVATAQSAPAIAAGKAAAAQAVDSTKYFAGSTILTTDTNESDIQTHADAIDDAANKIAKMPESERKEEAAKFIHAVGPTTNVRNRPYAERIFFGGGGKNPYTKHYDKAQAAIDRIKAMQ